MKTENYKSYELRTNEAGSYTLIYKDGDLICNTFSGRKYSSISKAKTKVAELLERERWAVKLENAHRMARGISYLDTMKNKTYRERLTVAMKVQHLLMYPLFVNEVNYLRNTLGRNFVRIHNCHDLTISIFEMTGGITEIDIYPYVAPRTVEQEDKDIEVMIQSEINSGVTLNLD